MNNYTSEGSPYFNDEYHNAQITLLTGAVYNNVKVKINLLDHLVQYQQADGSEMITAIPIKKIVFINFQVDQGVLQNVQLESFSGPLNSPETSIYEVLDSGRVSLLKKITVTYRDNKNYNEANTTRVFDRKEVYYSLAANGQLKKLEKGKAAMLQLFSDSRDKVAAYIEQHNLTCKTEEAYTDVFRFYNSNIP